MEPNREPNDDGELSRVLREWQAPDTPPWLEGRMIARRDARWRRNFVAGMALAAGLAAAAILVVRQPAPPLSESAVAMEAPFVPVPNVLPLDSYETGRVLRMDLPVSALIAAGYSLPAADPTATVTADVLVGEDGRAHAVRLVSDATLSGTGD
jgi:hypothetical protein